ncbi:MAG: prepilin-type N-terminal cleavage/methylation domain-containing protein [Pseudomonadota bacterium]
MSTRGYTLVELMITVAIIGISSGIVAGSARQARLVALGELQRERALLLLEYEAGCVERGRLPDPRVLARLQESLPDAEVGSERTGDLTTLTVHWRPPSGLRQQRSLTVFAGGTP